MWKLTLYAPNTKLKVLKHFLMYQNYTTVQAKGVWYDEKGKAQEEDVVIITMLLKEDWEAREEAEIASDMLLKSGEECVLYEIEHVNARFMYA